MLGYDQIFVGVYVVLWFKHRASCLLGRCSYYLQIFKRGIKKGIRIVSYLMHTVSRRNATFAHKNATYMTEITKKLNINFTGFLLTYCSILCKACVTCEHVRTLQIFTHKIVR
jgi:Na+-transporting NADH:ubiquinone oxidoreductase subunit NqrD